MDSGKKLVAALSCAGCLFLMGRLASANDVKIPLSCRSSVRLADLLHLPSDREQTLPPANRLEIGRAAACEAMGKQDVNLCGDLGSYGHDWDLACRKDYLFASLALYSQKNPEQLLGLCQTVFSGSRMLQASGVGAVCQALLEAAQTRNTDNACSVFATYAQDMKDPSRGAAICRESLAFMSGSSACKGARGGDPLVRCSDLAAMMTAMEDGNSRACGHSVVCLAAYEGNSAPCAALSHQAVSSFCSSRAISSEIKDMAVENGFRRVYHLGVYSPGQPFLAHDMLAQENRLRKKRGMPPFRMGDKLILMTPSRGRARRGRGDAGSDGDSSQP